MQTLKDEYLDTAEEISEHEKKIASYKKQVASNKAKKARVPQKRISDYGVGYEFDPSEMKDGILKFDLSVTSDKNFKHLQSAIVSTKGKIQNPHVNEKDTQGDSTKNLISTVSIGNLGVKNYFEDIDSIFVVCNKVKDAHDNKSEYWMSLFSGFVDSNMMPDYPKEAVVVIDKGSYFLSSRTSKCKDEIVDYYNRLIPGEALNQD